MIDLVQLMVNEVNVPLHEAVRMASTNPARALGLTTKGRLEVGADAELVVLSPGLEVVKTIRTDFGFRISGLPDRRVQAFNPSPASEQRRPDGPQGRCSAACQIDKRNCAISSEAVGRPSLLMLFAHSRQMAASLAKAFWTAAITASWVVATLPEFVSTMNRAFPSS